jgi:hypothetical protein
MPSPVDRYFREVKDSNPSYSDEQAWATAWSIYCKHKNPGSDHCQKKPAEYLTGKSASVYRVASRYLETVSVPQRVADRYRKIACEGGCTCGGQGTCEGSCGGACTCGHGST